MKKNYQYGMIEEVNLGRDGNIRSVNIKYRNSNEKVNRFTTRAVRQLVVIHTIDEVDKLNDLYSAAHFVDAKFIHYHHSDFCEIVGGV